VIRLWGGQQWNCGVIAGMGKNIQISSGAHRASFSVCVKQLGARKSPFIPSNAKINERSCTSFAPYAVVVCMGTTFTALSSLFLELQLDIFIVNFGQLPVGRHRYFAGFSTSCSFSII